ncbi:hypothetical protein I7I50_08375 [Histoplasma capsulatum G186AR]|uniref:Secreted protein n=1 Tax=Ajellomyces capsulatus TaxID=5037 RepID=A0A8H7YQ07_AJECA|nr:hypothetical protein I7I52_05891 [Histoplasma capsulatum]QSS73563.1 hypothetical protein I7I50_08375 [Histoplasma capsulatum G186AR]
MGCSIVTFFFFFPGRCSTSICTPSLLAPGLYSCKFSHSEDPLPSMGKWWTCQIHASLCRGEPRFSATSCQATPSHPLLCMG